MNESLNRDCGRLMDYVDHNERGNVIWFGSDEIISASDYKDVAQLKNSAWLRSKLPLKLYIQKDPDISGDKCYQISIFKDEHQDDDALEFENIMLADDIVTELNLPANISREAAYLTFLTRDMAIEVINVALNTAKKIQSERLASHFQCAAAEHSSNLAEMLKPPSQKQAEEFRAKFTVLEGGKPKAPKLA